MKHGRTLLCHLPWGMVVAAMLATAGPVEAQRPAAAPPAPAATAPDQPAPDSAAASMPQPSPGQPRPALPPADPAAAAAYTVLEKHCARCHQGGALKRPAPAGGFGNILRLDEVAEAPHLVQPGNPDASRLYLMMLRRLMPLDVHDDPASQAGPTPEETDAVRTWISSLAPHPACRDRRPVTPAEHARALAAEAGRSAGRVRFVSIAHLHNGCVGFETLKVYRQAIVKLINSLSWKPGLVPVRAVDEAETLFRINLDDLGWLPEHWERIVRSGPAPLGLVPPLPQDIRQPFAASILIARADWLADTVLRAPLYYEVLGLPGTGPEILKVLRVEHERSPRRGEALRAAVNPSGFSILPSLVERLPARAGGLWSSYHSIAREAAGDPSAFAEKPIAEAVPHHASRAMFALPNGLPAFYMVGQRGDRLDALPPDIARRAAGFHGHARAGLDCMSCHGGGPVLPDATSLPPPLAEAILADRRAVGDAHRRLGIDPALTLDGVEPIQALALEYARPLSALRASAEIGVDPEAMTALANEGEKPGAVLARRLVQGIVARAEIELRGHELLAALGRAPPSSPDQAGNTVAMAGARPPGTAGAEPDVAAIDPGPGLILYSDKTRYQQGDLLQLVVKVLSDCHLTLVSIDQRGRGTVIFPSDFENNALVTAGQEIRLPGPGAPYFFRLGERGREHIVALCNEVEAMTDGIRHDFERQRFTDLGNYAAFLVQRSKPKGDRADKAGGQQAQPRQRGRRRAAVEPAEPKARPEQISRTAISIVVE